MNEKLILLMEEAQKNEELQAKAKEAKNLEELYSITTQYVDGYSIDELKEGIEYIKTRTDNQEEAELSEEELDMVAAGSKDDLYNLFDKLNDFFPFYG